MDTYPRFTVTRAVKFSAEPERIAYRVSKRRADDLAFGFWPETRLHIALPPRFRITIAKYPTADPFILHDASRPAFRGQHRTLDLACVAMDNIIRRERRMPSRIGGLRETTERYLEAKARAERVQNLLNDRTVAVRPDAVIPPRHVNAPCAVEPIFPAEYVEEGINR